MRSLLEAQGCRVPSPILNSFSMRTIAPTAAAPVIYRKFLVVCCLLLLPVFAFAASRVPLNLGNGLDKLVESNLMLQAGAPALHSGHATSEAASYAEVAITDAQTGNYLVDVMPDGRVPFETLQATLAEEFPQFAIQSVDTKYRGHGVFEGFVALNDVPAIAKLEGVQSVILQVRPVTNVGAVTAQGVNNHRVNWVTTIYNPAAGKNIDGGGISVGLMSDSYDTSAQSSTRASADVATGDLPGPGNPINPQPVVVLQDHNDPANDTDEGRGMVQIVHDVAPSARLGFATAFGGEVGFANNIRALAGLPGYTYPAAIQQGFKADIVCDDVSYLTAPMFSDGIVAQAVNDVVAAGVTYTSSAANNWGTNGYASQFRPVANGTGLKADTNAALAGTNIDLTGVDTALYLGGFHDFNPGGAVDIAQTVNTGGSARRLIFQWNDPFDVSAPTIIEPPIFTATGASTPIAPDMEFTPPPFTQGQQYVIRVTQTGGNFDAIVEIKDPNGKTITDQDTGVDEVVNFFAPISGQYRIRVHPFESTVGTYEIKVNNATGVARITQDFNILIFDTAGKFVQAVASNNIANNRPVEFASLSLGRTQVQFVISRANIPTAPQPADQLKYLFFGNGASGLGPAEYNNYLTPVTYGHSAAAGANSCAAYSVFRPNIPEDFTSPGPVVIYFDENNNRLPTPEIRQKPDIAAADGVNTTFFPLGPVPFVGDAPYDPDDFPNFYGTSAASPNAAGVAALVLQAHGGPRSLTPAQVKQIFQETAFPTDLDPYQATGVADLPNGGKVEITVVSDNSRNLSTGSNDPNAFRVKYTGPGRLTELKFNAAAKAEEGGNPTGGNFNGFTPADFLDPTKYRYTPGMVWQSGFLFGNSEGLVAGDVTVTRTNPAPFPSNPSPGNPTAHTWTLNLSFPGGTGKNDFTGGKVLRFNNSRSQHQDAQTPQGMTLSVFVRSGDFSADILGDGVLIPEDPNGMNVRPGMVFSGTVVDGATSYPFTGRLTNNIGRGYSVLTGYGFINAQAAVAAPAPSPDATPTPTPMPTASPSATPNPTATPSPTPTVTPSASPTATPNPSATPQPTPTATPTASPSATPTPSPSATPEPSATPTPTPTPSPVVIKLVNISARSFVQRGDEIAIGGFIVRGAGPKRVIIRGIGPSMTSGGMPVPGRLENPFLQLYNSAGVQVFSNDNWRDSQEQQVKDTGLAPTHNLESAIVATLATGNYTAVLRGAQNTTGIGLVEIYDLDSSSGSDLANLSGRALVGRNDHVLIAGVITRGDSQRRVAFRAIGPSMRNQGVPNPLSNPILELRDGDGVLIMSNDDWRDAPNANEIESSGLRPPDDLESVILQELAPGNYTSIVRGVDGGEGIGLAETFKLNDPPSGE